jgi:hypothetical protein
VGYPTDEGIVDERDDQFDGDHRNVEAHVALVAIANRSSIANDPILRIPISKGMRSLCDRILDAGGTTGHARDPTSAALAGWVAFVREVTVEWLLDQRIAV